MAAELASEVMGFYSDNKNDLFFEVDGLQQTECAFQDLDLSSDGGIQLKISHQLYNRSLRQVASVIVAVEKLRKVPIVCSQDFQDEDLRSLFFCLFKEESINCVWDDGFECDAALQTLSCTLRDRNQKSLVLSEPHELQALHLNGPNINRQVVFSMSFVPGPESIDKMPVALGIKEKNLFLSCVMKDKKPTLQLETLDLNSQPKKKIDKRFVFNKTGALDKVEFESALYPNWYISTSQAEQMPVFLGSSRGGRDITDFTLEILGH
ncbi:interleukin-1 beta isoform 1-T2 [Molossus nigricans]